MKTFLVTLALLTSLWHKVLYLEEQSCLITDNQEERIGVIQTRMFEEANVGLYSDAIANDLNADFFEELGITSLVCQANLSTVFNSQVFSVVRLDGDFSVMSFQMEFSIELR